MENELVVYSLEEDVNELVISLEDRCLQRLVDYSRFNIEVCGYLVSAVYKRDLLLLGITTASIGDSQSVTFDNSYFHEHNEFLRRTKREIPSLVTVLYHNHPRVDVSGLDHETVRFLESGIQDGIYDYLRDYGIELTLEKVATEELTRHLSQEDILPSFGRASVLLTDTFYERNDFSHINAYRIRRGEDPFFERLKVVSLESKGVDYIQTYIQLTNKIDRIYWQVAEERFGPELDRKKEGK